MLPALGPSAMGTRGRNILHYAMFIFTFIFTFLDQNTHDPSGELWWVFLIHQQPARMAGSQRSEAAQCLGHTGPARSSPGLGGSLSGAPQLSSSVFRKDWGSYI